MPLYRVTAHGKRNGVWVALMSAWRIRFRHDCLYVAAGRVRVRVMKPGGGNEVGS
jgi:hypothetical protein